MQLLLRSRRLGAPFFSQLRFPFRVILADGSVGHMSLVLDANLLYCRTALFKYSLMCCWMGRRSSSSGPQVERGPQVSCGRKPERLPYPIAQRTPKGSSSRPESLSTRGDFRGHSVIIPSREECHQLDITHSCWC